MNDTTNTTAWSRATGVRVVCVCGVGGTGNDPASSPSSWSPRWLPGIDPLIPSLPWLVFPPYAWRNQFVASSQSITYPLYFNTFTTTLSVWKLWIFWAKQKESTILHSLQKRNIIYVRMMEAPIVYKPCHQINPYCPLCYSYDNSLQFPALLCYFNNFRFIYNFTLFLVTKSKPFLPG